MMDVMRANYRAEATDLLAQLESSLLELEASPEDAECVGQVFRQMHTIKGSGAMFGFDRIATFTHVIETTFDLVRSGKLKVSPELITTTLRARDHIKSLLEAEFGGPTPDLAIEQVLLGCYQRWAGLEAPLAAAKVETGPAGGELATFRIHFRPPADAFLRGINLVLLLNALREMGACTVVGQTRELPELGSLNPEHCYLYWDIELRTRESENTIRDTFIFVEDDSELTIERLAEQEPNRGPDVVQVAVESPTPMAERPVEANLAHPGGAPAASAEQERVKQITAERAKAQESATIRVAAEKLDSLVNTVGEMVTAQARLSQLAAAAGDPELDFAVEELERLTGRLRDDTMSIRMLPIGATFSRFRRLVRDLCRDLGKEIELVTEGGETELDKTVIEQLNDPLVHIIRNSIDHGIESPEVRRAAGKPARATVRLSAVHSGTHVLVRITDDGAGLDRARILAKAVERGLVPGGVELPDSEVFSLIFRPGFSTAAAVTEISGRGVGLDVVQRSIQALRGSVDVRSVPGQGTTFTLKLPLTMAIIEGLLVEVGEQQYVMPMCNVVECVELTREDIRRNHGRKSVVVRNELVPYVGLREYFGLGGPAPEFSQVMLADTERGKFGFVVDRVIGDHQTVVKSLGRVYAGVESVSGATILGDGNVALILDLEKMAKEAVEHADDGQPVHVEA
jgi:two-component system chemotaxis sensor kinase CheA